MKTHTRLSSLREQVREWRCSGLRVAFVPTMGNLHGGHYGLVEYAQTLADRVVVSIFVNPTQFGPTEDFASYPRTLEADSAGLVAGATAALYLPGMEEIYPYGESVAWVDVPALSQILCGAVRPGHFRGVASVVARLFNHVAPDVAVFGEKDYQQLLVIRRMSTDLGFPIDIRGAPIARDADGLAMSSRNQYLTSDERALAPWLYALLQEVVANIGRGQALAIAAAEGRERLTAAGFRPDYLEVRRRSDLLPPGDQDQALIVLVAAYLGRARLLDNIQFNIDRQTAVSRS